MMNHGSAVPEIARTEVKVTFERSPVRPEYAAGRIEGFLAGGACFDTRCALRATQHERRWWNEWELQRKGFADECLLTLLLTGG